jgi:NAD(P)H-dependent flavin oxidoreductase YrpB (nitropropane dioxygenase family)
MGSVSSVELAAAVSNAGGLGMVAAPLVPAPVLEQMLGQLARSTDGPFGLNVLMPFLDRACVDVAAANVRVVEFFYGDPDAALVSSAKAGGALASWQIGSVDEAKAAVDAGCDIVVAQGTQAGGHVRGMVELRPLLDAVLGAVDVPVVAAGGIGTAADVRAALDAGASAVRIGTRFVAAAEADTHPDYATALIAASADDTVLTEAFSVMWPDAPHRVLRPCVDRATSLDTDVVAEVVMGDATMPVPRLGPMAPTRATRGDVAAMAMYAGTSVDGVHRVQPAAEIVDELMSEMQ